MTTGRILGTQPDSFVGRDRELGILAAALQTARAGHGTLVLIGGEPGIGKTRLAEELGGRARRDGSAVCWGRCWEGEGAPAFWPWVQMVRHYCAGRAAGELRADLGLAINDVARVVPELSLVLDEVVPGGTASGFAATPEHERFRFFDGLTRFWLAASRRQPIVLVLDDVQWADTASLRLWEFLTREVGAGAVLMLALYRESEVGPTHPLHQALGAIVREPVCQRLPLRGLGEVEIARYVELLSGERLEPALVTRLARRTEGNPFFLRELVHLMQTHEQPDSDRWQQTLPVGVRQAISRRLITLSFECNRLLSLAAVIGPEFGLTLLSAVAGDAADTTRVQATLQAAEDGGLIRPVDELGTSYAFTHAMIQETLLATLTDAVRAWLHGRIGTELERMQPGRAGRPLAELARHFLAAGEASVNKAYDYARQAGDASLKALAYEESVQWYERALALLEHGRTADATDRCELLLALGDAQMRAGQIAAARATSFRAAEIARQCGDATRFARAALGFGWLFQVSVVDRERLALLEEALATLPAGDSALRARVMARIAAALYWAPRSGADRAQLGAEAVAIARRLGDAATLAYTLNTNLFACWDAQHMVERARDARELLALAESAGEHELTLQSRHWLVTSLLENGDLVEAKREMAAHTRLAQRLRQPLYLWFEATWKAMEAFMTGQLDRVESLAQEALALGERVEPENAQQAYAALLFCLRREQGRLAEFLPVIEAIMTQPDAAGGWRSALALIYAESGRFEDANRELDLLARSAAAAATDATDSVILGEVAALLRRREDCARLYAHLQPTATQGIVLGMGIAHFGSTSRFLGLLAAALERFDDAERHFADAQAMHERMRARPLIAHTQYAWAAMLLRRGAPGDRERAEGMLATAFDTARELGLESLRGKVEALRESVGRGQSAVGSADTETVGSRQPAVGSPGTENGKLGTADRAPEAVGSSQSSVSSTNTESREPGTGDWKLGTSVFRRSGDMWSVTFAGESCQLRDARGLRYLAGLLHRPGQELHAADLVSSIDGAAPAAAHAGDAKVSADLGDAGTVLDATATAEYQQRLTALREELAEAEAHNDLGRSARLREELAFLTEELAHAGRGRRAASHAERARVAVTKGIRAALTRIAAAHPTLGKHLEATVRTGYFCSYTPDPSARIRWLSAVVGIIAAS